MESKMGHQSRSVWLRKDNKLICRTLLPRVVGLDAPPNWNIDGYHRHWPPHLECSPLYPDAEDDRQDKEWKRFLTYLRNKSVVASIKGELYDFYVHPPSQGEELNRAIVYYRRKTVPPTVANQDVGLDLDVPKSPCSAESTPIVVNMAQHSCQAKETAPSCQLNHPRKSNIQKNFVKTDPSYLVTLAQGHAGWIFGAIAELVDNSQDANSTKLDITIDLLYSKREEKKIPVLSVVDNGRGMCHMDVVRMLSFGHKQPEKDQIHHIGRFGIGFKTGSMKLGRDALILTQTMDSRSVAFLSQSFNKNKENIEVPMVSYRKRGQYMEIDSSIQSEDVAYLYLKIIKDFSPFNEYFIGEKLGLFGENGSGTQIYIWNLDEWGSDFCLEWENQSLNADGSLQSQGDILIRSRRIRSRPGQISQKVPLDYSLREYVEVLYLQPRMEICIQRSLVKSQPLLNSLNNVAIVEGTILGKPIKLTLGYNKLEWERMNCGIFVYWHGRLIEAYKRVAGMVHNADMGRGVIGVVDVTHIMSDGNGQVLVLNNKQGFQDSEIYAKLEEWLGQKFEEYWDANYDPLKLKKWDPSYKPEHEWVACDKCHKWRVLPDGYDRSSLPNEWFCCLPPFNGRCEIPEKPVDPGIVTVAARRSGHDTSHKKETKRTPASGGQVSESSVGVKNVRAIKQGHSSEGFPPVRDQQLRSPALKRLHKGPSASRHAQP